MSVVSFTKNNNVYDHVYNVYDHYLYEFRVEISIMPK